MKVLFSKETLSQETKPFIAVLLYQLGSGTCKFGISETTTMLALL